MDNQVDRFSENSTISQLPYENAYSELEGIIKALESEEHTLDEALALFERGQALIQHCANLLDKAEMKIQQLRGEEISGYSGELN